MRSEDTDLRRLVEGLRARKSASGWTARCPAHDDRTPSLSIGWRDARVLLHCFGGCTQAEVLDALRRRGLWPKREKIERPQHPPLSERGTQALGLRYWHEATALYPGAWPAGLVTYFASRGLVPFEPCPALRFHPRLPHSRGVPLPALLALATDAENRPAAVQATYLRADGSGKAPIDPVRKTFGSARGAAVRLMEGDDVLMVGEGVESVLSVLQAVGEGGYALLGTSGLKSIVLPEVYAARRIIIAADNDASGAGQRAALEAARRLVEQQKFLDVRIATPPRTGTDFNDRLRSAA
ncbi:MAG: toprim domain-containing protein [Alphaproteobacteria bacterium]|nr:toprim domain-containing protein [Alphaproteobacteria bacterium]